MRELPYKSKISGILPEIRYDYLSRAGAKKAYYDLAEILKDNRGYITHLVKSINLYKIKLRRKKRWATFRYKRFKQRIPYIRKSIRAQQKVEVDRLKAKLKAKFSDTVKQRVRTKVERATANIPKKVNTRVTKKVDRVKLKYKKKLETAKNNIRGSVNVRVIKRVARAREAAKQRAFIGIAYKTKLPRIGQSAGLHGIIINQISRSLKITPLNLSYLLWFGTFETLNSGSLQLLYPFIGYQPIRSKIHAFVQAGYIQQIGQFKRKKTYAFTALGKEVYDRIIRYMKLYNRPGQKRRINKVVLRKAFKTL